MTPVHLGWARSPDQALELQDAARPGPDAVLTDVTYTCLDHTRTRFARHRLGGGPREITDPAELADPPWRRRGADSVDHGVQLGLSDGRRLSIGWDTPTSDHEGLGLAWTPFLAGPWLHPGSDVALWDAGRSSEQWRAVVGRPLLDVELTFAVDQLGLHCRCVALTFDGVLVHITGGDDDGDGRVVSSGDNLLVHRL